MSRSSAARDRRSPPSGSPENAEGCRSKLFGNPATGDDSGHRLTPNRSLWIRLVARIIK
ncbi:hypothetical protein PanWU01x14_175090, partial [Parasponia andersonii]